MKSTASVYPVPQRVVVKEGKYGGQQGTLVDVRKPWGLHILVAQVNLDIGIEFYVSPNHLTKLDGSPIDKDRESKG